MGEGGKYKNIRNMKNINKVGSKNVEYRKVIWKIVGSSESA